MTNDLKNFLEEEKKTYSRYLYGGKYNLSKDEFNELTDHDARLINFVLDLVEKEVENIDTGFETRFNHQYRAMKEQVSTIVNNLRVK